LKNVVGYHSEWNLGSPGGWDYQRITQEIGKAIWEKYFQSVIPNITLDFDHPLLYPIYGFMEMLKEFHYEKSGAGGLIAVMAEEETLEDVVENQNLASHLDAMEGLSGILIAPHELELFKNTVCWRGQPVSTIFMDFNTDVLLNLHRKHDLSPVLQAVREGRVINPRGTEPINVKSMFELITSPESDSRFNSEVIKHTPWTRQFYPRTTQGPRGEDISDLIEWTRANWEHLVLKPERGYSGKGVFVGGVHTNIDSIIQEALSSNRYGTYIVQERVPLEIWSEDIPELDIENRRLVLSNRQTDFRCLFGPKGLFGFLNRYGGIPTNVGSGGGVQPLALLRSNMGVKEATELINRAVIKMDYGDVHAAVEDQKDMAMKKRFTYVLGPIKIAIRPRLLTADQIHSLQTYCAHIWDDCLAMERMWIAGELDNIVNIEPEELDIIRSQPWKGSPSIFATDGLFSFVENNYDH
jgi:hypothetical protein